jgi:hypothetical protein
MLLLRIRMLWMWLVHQPSASSLEVALLSTTGCC